MALSVFFSLFLELDFFLEVPITRYVTFINSQLLKRTYTRIYLRADNYLFFCVKVKSTRIIELVIVISRSQRSGAHIHDTRSLARARAVINLIINSLPQRERNPLCAMYRSPSRFPSDPHSAVTERDDFRDDAFQTCARAHTRISSVRLKEDGARARAQSCSHSRYRFVHARASEKREISPWLHYPDNSRVQSTIRLPSSLPGPSSPFLVRSSSALLFRESPLSPSRRISQLPPPFQAPLSPHHLPTHLATKLAPVFSRPKTIYVSRYALHPSILSYFLRLSLPPSSFRSLHLLSSSREDGNGRCAYNSGEAVP